MNNKIKQFIEENTNKHLCDCGCGNFIEIKEHHYYYGIPKYRHGDNAKTKEFRDNQSLKTSKEWEDGIHDLDGEKRTQFYIDNPGARETMSDLKKEQYKNGLLPPNLGIPHTEVAKQKMSDNHWDNAGENHPMFGKHHTDEAKDKMSIAHKRENLSKETLQSMRDSHKRENLSEELLQIMRNSHLGNKHTDESKEKNRNCMLKFQQNKRWNAQVTNLINGTPITDWISRPSRHYGISEDDYNIWRRAVYERDLHTCRICGANHCLIHAHHIIPQRINQDLIIDTNNGITMCRMCHELTYGKEEIYSEELQMIIDGII